jgi:hypothetical protein
MGIRRGPDPRSAHQRSSWQGPAPLRLARGDLLFKMGWVCHQVLIQQVAFR